MSGSVESRPAGRVVLITGAGRGLGKALALHLAGPETLLLLHHHRSGGGAESVAQQARDKGARTQLLPADLSDREDREHMVRRVAEITGRLHVLVNNAGIYEDAELPAIDAERWGWVMEITCNAVHHLIHGLTPLLRQAAPAHVINIGDSAADRISARTTATHYHVAKLGVHVLTRSYAKSLGPDGITVNQVSPGFLRQSVGEPGSSIPLGREGAHADVIAAVSYLLSSEADYVTGANIVVSGGWNL